MAQPGIGRGAAAAAFGGVEFEQADTVGQHGIITSLKTGVFYINGNVLLGFYRVDKSELVTAVPQLFVAQKFALFVILPIPAHLLRDKALQLETQGDGSTKGVAGHVLPAVFVVKGVKIVGSIARHLNVDLPEAQLLIRFMH